MSIASASQSFRWTEKIAENLTPRMSADEIYAAMRRSLDLKPPVDADSKLPEIEAFRGKGYCDRQLLERRLFVTHSARGYFCRIANHFIGEERTDGLFFLGMDFDNRIYWGTQSDVRKFKSDVKDSAVCGTALDPVVVYTTTVNEVLSQHSRLEYTGCPDTRMPGRIKYKKWYPGMLTQKTDGAIAAEEFGRVVNTGMRNHEAGITVSHYNTAPNYEITRRNIALAQQKLMVASRPYTPPEIFEALERTTKDICTISIYGLCVDKGDHLSIINLTEETKAHLARHEAMHRDLDTRTHDVPFIQMIG